MIVLCLFSLIIAEDGGSQLLCSSGPCMSSSNLRNRLNDHINGVFPAFTHLLNGDFYTA